MPKKRYLKRSSAVIATAVLMAFGAVIPASATTTYGSVSTNYYNKYRDASYLRGAAGQTISVDWQKSTTSSVNGTLGISYKVFEAKFGFQNGRSETITFRASRPATNPAYCYAYVAYERKQQKKMPVAVTQRRHPRSSEVVTRRSTASGTRYWSKVLSPRARRMSNGGNNYCN